MSQPLTSLFRARATVAIADKLASLHPVTGDQGVVQRARMALGGMRDVPDAAAGLLARGIRDGDPKCLLEAFWRAHVAELELYPAKARLLVNPPADLTGLGENVHTLRTQDHLGYKSAYGTTFEHSGPPAGVVPGYYDDVAIFWGRGMAPHVAAVAKRVIPGTTLTLVFPGQTHTFWTAFVELTLEAGELQDHLERQFTLQEVYHGHTANIEVMILGVEAK